MDGMVTLTELERQTDAIAAVAIGSARPASNKTTARRSLTSCKGSKVALSKSTRPTIGSLTRALTVGPSSNRHHAFGVKYPVFTVDRGQSEVPVCLGGQGEERALAPPVLTAQAPRGSQHASDA